MSTVVAEAPGTRRWVIHRALQHLKRLRRQVIAYEEECREWARQGYRPHFCIHGTNLWVDYDNICGPCEDGLTLHQLALMYAWQDWNQFDRRANAIKALVALNPPKEAIDALVTWVGESISSEVR